MRVPPELVLVLVLVPGLVLPLELAPDDDAPVSGAITSAPASAPGTTRSPEYISSFPPTIAVKKILPPCTATSSGLDEPGPGTRSVHRVSEPAVPSLVQSSLPA